jgi:PKHD-type hydroxylase
MNLTFNNFEVAKFLYKFVWVDNLLSKEDLKEISNYCNNLKLNNATLGDLSETANEKVRKSKVAFEYVNNENFWLFEKLKYVAETINNDFYRFNLTGFDHFQYTEYQSNNSHYDFHSDIFYDSASENANLDDYYQNRKLSISIILNNVTEFEGGEFQFSDNSDLNNIEVAEQQFGRVIAFPSFVPHRVTPVVKGTRKSLVYWVTGPKFQ